MKNFAKRGYLGNFAYFCENLNHNNVRDEEIKSTIECGFGSFGDGFRGLQNRGAYAANYQG